MKLGRAKNETTNQPNRRSKNDSPKMVRPSQEDLSSRYAFRRNRTLTGSSSASVASSNELNAELRSPRAHVHHLTNLRRKLLSYLAVVSIAAFGLYVLVSQLVATTAVAIRDQPPLTNEIQSQYQEAFESYYAARPAERFRFVLNQDALLSHVQAEYPEIRSIRINPGSNLGEASITLTAREPIARWNIEGSNKYVDGDGIVFSKNYFGDPELQIVDESGLPASSSKIIASDRFLGFIGRVVAKSHGSGLPVNKVTIPLLTTRQVAVTLEGSETQYKLSVDRSAGEQVEDIARISNYLTNNQLAPGYVDVRLAGKAYYK